MIEEMIVEVDKHDQSIAVNEDLYNKLEMKVRKKSKCLREDTNINISPVIIDWFKEGITLLIDIMHVNKVLFLVTKDYHLNYY